MDPTREGSDATGLVAVGVDGSAGSAAALAHALGEAALRAARLMVVTVVRLPAYWDTSYGLPPPVCADEVLGDARLAAQRMVDQAIASGAPRVPVEVVASVGSPAEVLLELTRNADLLVLGHRGRGGVAGCLLGSVAMQCALHAGRPLVIVRPGSEQSRWQRTGSPATREPVAFHQGGVRG